jgi:hypothetical protein
MPAPAGYTLDQLLSWCLEDKLIDSYQKADDVIVIVQGDLEHELALGEAEAFLKGIFKYSPLVRTRKIIGPAPITEPGSQNEA